MQQSPTISIEQESSVVTISHNSSEYSLNKAYKLEKWCRMTKRIVQFFRFIKIPMLRSRFINTISHISTDRLEIEELNDYDVKKIQEDFLFLDDIKRYQEVFNTFSSFGFIWQDKEFRLAKLKANYIYDHYISTSEAISKTNIPLETISFIYHRMNSPRIFSSLIYLNLFNDAEKFITEKLLMIYMREGLNCFSTLQEKQSISIMNRYKTEKSISDRSNSNLKDTINIEPQFEEIIIPNWTYSTGLGVVYNPIREKCVKITKRNAQKKTKDVDLRVNTPNEIKQFDSKSLLPIHHSPKLSSRINRQHYNRCDRIFNKISQKVFICKVHSSPWPNSNPSILKHEPSYRMTFKPQPTHFSNRLQRLCH